MIGRLTYLCIQFFVNLHDLFPFFFYFFPFFGFPLSLVEVIHETIVDDESFNFFRELCESEISITFLEGVETVVLSKRS